MESYNHTPIKVKKVSQLSNFGYYYKEQKLDLNNSYLLVGYPSNDSTIPHNFKISFSDLSNAVAKLAAEMASITISYVTYYNASYWDNTNSDTSTTITPTITPSTIAIQEYLKWNIDYNSALARFLWNPETESNPYPQPYENIIWDK